VHSTSGDFLFTVFQFRFSHFHPPLHLHHNNQPGAESVPAAFEFSLNDSRLQLHRRPHFQSLSSRIFFNLPLHSSANNKVIDMAGGTGF
jgi:hypothetical protein